MHRKTSIYWENKCIDFINFFLQVCLRNNPLYHAGAVAFSVSAGIPKVGVLLESVWNMNDSCRFQLRSPESLKNMEKTTKTQEIKSVVFYLAFSCEFCLSVASSASFATLKTGGWIVCVSIPAGWKANPNWWRLRWVLPPPRLLPAAIHLLLLAAPLCPTVRCSSLSAVLNCLVSQAQTQFLPHFGLSLVLWLWSRWSTGCDQ